MLMTFLDNEKLVSYTSTNQDLANRLLLCASLNRTIVSGGMVLAVRATIGRIESKVSVCWLIATEVTTG